MELTTDDINLLLSCISFSVRAISNRDVEKTERITDLFKITTYRMGPDIRIDVHPLSNRINALFANEERD